MQYNGKECTPRCFFGDTPEEAQAEFTKACAAENVLKAEMKRTSQEPARYCIQAFIEDKPVRQQLNEG